MKKCTYCGKEHSNDATACAVDCQPLASDDPQQKSEIDEHDSTLLSPPVADSAAPDDSGFVGRLFSLEGRVARGTYWRVHILAVVVWWVLVASGMSRNTVMLLFWAGTAVIGWVGLAISARRWHDMGCSAWCLLILLVPFIGGLVTLGALGFRGGTIGSNRFGVDPVPRKVDGTTDA